MIRIILTSFLTLLSFAFSFAQETHSVTVNFNGMKSNEGKLYVALYNSKDNFLKQPYKGEIVAIKDLKATAVFDNLPVGTYAISTFQDINENGKMDTNFFGIPKEPIGTSNDAKGFMGPPKFKKAKFSVNNNTTIQIKVVSIF